MLEKIKNKFKFNLPRKILLTKRIRRIIIIVSFIFLAIILTTPLADLTRLNKDYYDMSEQENILTAEELGDFLQVWSALLERNIADYNNLQLSFGNDNAEDGLPPQLVRWLKTQGWGVERFFYNEQKVLELVSLVKLEKNVQTAGKMQGKLGSGSLSAIIKAQQEQLKNMNPNPQEYELIKINFEQINSIIQKANK